VGGGGGGNHEVFNSLAVGLRRQAVSIQLPLVILQLLPHRGAAVVSRWAAFKASMSSW